MNCSIYQDYLHGHSFVCIFISVGQSPFVPYSEQVQYLTLNYLTSAFNLNYLRILQLTQLTVEGVGVSFVYMPSGQRIPLLSPHRLQLPWKLVLQGPRVRALCCPAALRVKVSELLQYSCSVLSAGSPTLTVNQRAESRVISVTFLSQLFAVCGGLG